MSTTAQDEAFRKGCGLVSTFRAKQDYFLVERMLDAKRRLGVALLDKHRNFYPSKCTHLDREIDALVYDLYDLTAEEIKLVEAQGT
jgi:hypothetical protein